MLPDRVSNPGPLNYESGALPVALGGPAKDKERYSQMTHRKFSFVITDTRTNLVEQQIEEPFRNGE